MSTRSASSWLTPEQSEVLLKLEMSPRDRAIVSIFLYAGLRSNELKMLDVEDIDFAMSEIVVRFGKGKKRRIVPLHPIASEALKNYLNDRSTGPIFLNRFNARLTNRALRMLIKSLGKQAGLKKDLHPTALRHSFAVALIRNFVDFDTIRDLMGHTRPRNMNVTALYALHGTTDKRTAIDILWPD